MKKSLFNFNGGKMGLSYLLPLLFLLIVMPLISAVPPVTQVQSFNEGYVIQIPQDNIIKLKQSYTFEFHVSNISNGIPIVAGASCMFHLYGPDGVHILTMYDDTVSNSYDYEFFVDGKNFTSIESYYYYIGCNSSSRGGFSESILRVTPSGIESTNNYFWLIIVLSIGLMILGFALRNAPITILGSFASTFVGLYIIINGINGIKDNVYTWVIGLILLVISIYIAVKSSWEMIEDIPLGGGA